MSDRQIQPAHVLCFTGDTFLWWYSVFYQKHFGEKGMVYNFHLLSHIKTSVVNYGPVWSHSAYPYEGENRYILQLAKNHTCVALEIANKFTAYQSLPKLISSVLGLSIEV
ncbi:Protein HflK, partial [Frankliniella fusca]